jgi:uncharacterized lipoprotein YajG
MAQYPQLACTSCTPTVLQEKTMKKTGMVLVAAVFVLAACGKGTMTKDFGDLFDNAAKELNGAAVDLKAAKDAPAVAAALNKVYNTMSALKTKSAELEKKHGMQAKGAMPPELKAKNEEFQKAIKTVFSPETQAVMQKYAAKPEVLEVLNKIKGLRG